MRGRRHEKGAILLLAALGLMVLLLFAGLAIDSGLLQLQKAQLQTAADAAAVAAAHELSGGDQGRLLAAAREDAALNGYGEGPAGENRVVVYHPPRQGRYAGDANAVEVVASHRGRTLLLTLSGRKSTTVTARAVGLRDPGGNGVLLGE